MSTVSPASLRASNGVRVCGMNLCTTLVYQHQFIPCYSSANARILKPFEDSELTGLKWIQRSTFSLFMISLPTLVKALHCRPNVFIRYKYVCRSNLFAFSHLLLISSAIAYFTALIERESHNIPPPENIV